MQTVEALHREAMELVDRAILARQCGDRDQMTALTRAASSDRSLICYIKFF